MRTRSKSVCIRSYSHSRYCRRRCRACLPVPSGPRPLCAELRKGSSVYSICEQECLCPVMGRMDPRTSRVTKCFRVWRPRTKSAGNHVPDDGADIAFLRGIIVRPRVIARDCHRPAAFPCPQLAQEPCSVSHIQTRIEHRLDRDEFFPVIMVVDLHAAEIDQPPALKPCGPELAHRLDRAGG